MLNRSKTWAGLLLLVAFVTGAVVGGAAVTAWADGRGRPGGARRPGYAARLQTDLNLTSAQRDSVDAILKSYKPRVDANWESIRPALEAYNARWDTLRTDVRGRITTVLTDAQRQKFQEISARSDSARRAHDVRANRGRDSAANRAR